MTIVNGGSVLGFISTVTSAQFGHLEKNINIILWEAPPPTPPFGQPPGHCGSGLQAQNQGQDWKRIWPPGSEASPEWTEPFASLLAEEAPNPGLYFKISRFLLNRILGLEGDSVHQKVLSQSLGQKAGF